MTSHRQSLERELRNMREYRECMEGFGTEGAEYIKRQFPVACTYFLHAIKNGELNYQEIRYLTSRLSEFAPSV